MRQCTITGSTLRGCKNNIVRRAAYLRTSGVLKGQKNCVYGRNRISHALHRKRNDANTMKFRVKGGTKVLNKQWFFFLLKERRGSVKEKNLFTTPHCILSTTFTTRTAQTAEGVANNFPFRLFNLVNCRSWKRFLTNSATFVKTTLGCGWKVGIQFWIRATLKRSC
jgi:hypothetical protein